MPINTTIANKVIAILLTFVSLYNNTIKRKRIYISDKLTIVFKQSNATFVQYGLYKDKNFTKYKKIDLIILGICCKQDIIKDTLNNLVKLISVQKLKLAQHKQANKRLTTILIIKSKI